MVENTVGKGEIAHYEQFLLFPWCFQKACFPGCQKVSLCGNGLNNDLLGRYIGDALSHFLPKHDLNVYGEGVYSMASCLVVICIEPFPKQQILDSSKMEEFADDNFEFNENGRKFSKRVENTEGKGEIACYKQFLLFPQCFQKDLYCRHVQNQGLFGKGLTGFLQ